VIVNLCNDRDRKSLSWSIKTTITIKITIKITITIKTTIKKKNKSFFCSSIRSQTC